MRRGTVGRSASSSTGSSRCFCRVHLLDGSDFTLDVLNKKSNAQVTFDQVIRHFGIVDKEFFGFEYEDEQKNPQWVDLQKSLKKQIKKIPFKVLFRVKYYPLDPMIPHISCRTHFYQQLRKDMADGILNCPVQTASCIVAYILQADLGDYESTFRDVEYIRDKRLLLLDESPDLQEEIVGFHQLYKGMNALEAVAGFLRKVRDLDTYGIQLYHVRYEDNSCQVGISPGGVSIFRRNRRVMFHDWSMVAEVSFKNKKFLVIISGIGQQDPTTTYTFEMESLKACKDLWKICADSASFYSEPNRRIREEPETARSPGAHLPTANFAYPQSSTTLKENTRLVTNNTNNIAVKAAQKSTSLPHNFPGSDPISTALMQHEMDFCDTPTSVDDFTSLSTSASENMSPLTPLSPVHPHSDMDMILPGIPNLRDEEGLPLNNNNHQSKDKDKKKKFKYKDYQSHFKEDNSSSSRSEIKEEKFENGDQLNISRVGREKGPPEDENSPPEVPPMVPPRNYNSQYRNQHHPQAQRASHGNTEREENGGASNSNTNLGDLSDTSLLDLADELGGRNSSGSLHSSSERRSQTEVGRALGYSSEVQNGKYSLRPNYNTLPSSFHKQHSNEATPPDHSPRFADYPPSKSPAMGTNASGRGLAKTWLQEQQLRSYQSGSSQESSGSIGHSSSSRSHPLQPSPDMESTQANQHQHQSYQQQQHKQQQQQQHHHQHYQQQQYNQQQQHHHHQQQQQHNQQQQYHHHQHNQQQQHRHHQQHNHHHHQQQQLQPSPDTTPWSQASSSSSRSSRSLPRGDFSFDLQKNETRNVERETFRKDKDRDSNGFRGVPQDRSAQDQTHVGEREPARNPPPVHSHPQKPHPSNSHHHNWSHDQHQRSHDSHQMGGHSRSHVSNLSEDNEYPLPNSPAPPPYKSPSPDSEHAQILQQLSHRPPHQQPPNMFTFHSSDPGMGPEHSIHHDTGREKRVPKLESHSKSPRNKDTDMSRSHNQPTEATDQNLPSRSNTTTPHSESPAHSMPPDMLREIDELMGGVEALFSDDSADERDEVIVTNPRDKDEGGREEQVAMASDGRHGDTRPTTNGSSEGVVVDESFGGVVVDRSEVTEPRAKRKVGRSLKKQKIILHHMLGKADNKTGGSSKFGDSDAGVRDDRFPSENRSRARSDKTGFTSLETDSDSRFSGVDSALAPLENKTTSIYIEAPPTEHSNHGNEEGIEIMPDQLYRDARRGVDDNLADILQEVMATDNLPPPPAHLRALSQELENQSQGYRYGDSDATDSGGPPLSPPAISFTYNDDPNLSRSNKLPQDGAFSFSNKTESPLYDPRMFSRRKIEVPENNLLPFMMPTSARLPPEIANFMCRVRSFSAGGSDGVMPPHNPSQHSDSDSKRPPHNISPQHSDSGSKKPPISRNVVSLDDAGGWGGDDANGPSAGGGGNVAVDETRVPIYDSLGTVKISESVVPTRKSHDVKQIKIPAHHDNAHKQNVNLDKEPSSKFNGHDTSENSKSSSPHHREDEGVTSWWKFPTTADVTSPDVTNSKVSSAVHGMATQDAPQVKSTTDPPRSDKIGGHLLSESHPLPPDSLRPKAISLPRGQVAPYHVHHSSHHDSTSSHDSTPTTPQSDLVAPVYPQRNRGVEKVRHHGGTSSSGAPPHQHLSFGGRPADSSNVRGVERNLSPGGYSMQQQGGQKYREKMVSSDVKRAQTFSSGSRYPSSKQAAPVTAIQRELSSPGPSPADSLPNSPTYFTQVQERREAPSPRTKMSNQSFQDHLKSLDAQTKMRKRKVLDWIQRSSNTKAWEGSKKEEKDGKVLELDASAHLPSRPYHKVSPIYATADNPNSTYLEPELDQARTRNAGPASNWRHAPEQRTGMGDHRFKMEPRQGVEIGSRMEQNRPVAQRHFSYSAQQQGPGNQGDASKVQRSNTGVSGYPTAKFGKEYYVLDV